MIAQRTVTVKEPRTVIVRANRPSSSEKVVSVTKAFDTIRNDYDVSRGNRFTRKRTGLAPQGGGADYHYRTESQYYTDIEKFRDMERNDCIVGQTTQRATDNIVQDGFTLEPQSGDSLIDDELYYRFKEWAEDPRLCDVAGEYTFHDYEQNHVNAMNRDGDGVSVCTEDGQLQFFEGHTIQTLTTLPNTVLGVQKDEFNRRQKYHVVIDPIEPMGHKEQGSPIDVYNEAGRRQLFHVYNSHRMHQTRGVSAYAPIFSLSGMFEDIQFAKMVQQQVVSCFAIFRKRSGASGLPGKNASYGQPTTEVNPAGTRYLENIAPGMEIIGEVGEELQGFSPNIPNSEYFQHVRLMLQLIGVNLGLPLCLVLMDGSETNFSGWRGAVDEARKGFRRNQNNLVKRFHRPLYELKVSQWIAEDPALRAVSNLSGIDLFKHKWNTPKWAYIEPEKDANGDSALMEKNLKAPRQVHANNGDEWFTFSDESTEDWGYHVRNAKRIAMAINKEFADGDPVGWREIAKMSMPQGLQMAVQDPAEANQENGGGAGERRLTIMEALQKIYLAVGTVITADEARSILESEYDITLPEGFDMDEAMGRVRNG